MYVSRKSAPRFLFALPVHGQRTLGGGKLLGSLAGNQCDGSKRVRPLLGLSSSGGSSTMRAFPSEGSSL